MENNVKSLPTLLDEMVDFIVKFEEIPFLDLVQYVWRRELPLSSVPDPCDTDTLRYALKACILERMAEIWSQPPKNTVIAAPAWCQYVPAVQEQFSVIAPEFAHFWQGEACSPIFKKRNIIAPENFMFFL